MGDHFRLSIETNGLIQTRRSTLKFTELEQTSAQHLIGTRRSYKVSKPPHVLDHGFKIPKRFRMTVEEANGCEARLSLLLMDQRAGGLRAGDALLEGGGCFGDLTELQVDIADAHH